MRESHVQPAETARLVVGDDVFDLPIKRGVYGHIGIAIKEIFTRRGFYTYDPGFFATANTESAITYIDGDKGILLYRGYPIEQVADQGSFLETAFLLLNSELPDKAQYAEFEMEIGARMAVDAQMVKILEAHRRATHPMALIKSLTATMSTFTTNADLKTPEGRNDVALNLIAKIPMIVAMSYRYTNGLPIVWPDPDLGYTENFLKMCFAAANGSYSVNPVVAKALDKIFILHADHEQNASTSTVRLAGSTGVEPYAAVSAGIAALWGPAHGGANEAVLEMLERIGAVDNAPAFLELVKSKGPDAAKLMGFGHRIYKNHDPRAKIIKASSDAVLSRLGVNDPLFALAKALEEHALRDEYFKSRKLYPNVDFYSGITLRAMGFPTSMFTPLFALARTTGWIAQWKEMVEQGPLVIGRPRQHYVGPEKRDWVKFQAR